MNSPPMSRALDSLNNVQTTVDQAPGRPPALQWLEGVTLLSGLYSLCRWLGAMVRSYARFEREFIRMGTPCEPSAPQRSPCSCYLRSTGPCGSRFAPGALVPSTKGGWLNEIDETTLFTCDRARRAQRRLGIDGDRVGHGEPPRIIADHRWGAQWHDKGRDGPVQLFDRAVLEGPGEPFRETVPQDPCKSAGHRLEHALAGSADDGADALRTPTS